MGALHLLIALFRWLDKQQRESQARAAAASAGAPPVAPPQGMNAAPARPGTVITPQATSMPQPGPTASPARPAPPAHRPNASIVDDAPAGLFGRLLRLLE